MANEKTLLEIANENLANHKKDTRKTVKLNKKNEKSFEIFSRYQEEKYERKINYNEAFELLFKFYFEAVIKNNLDESTVLNGINSEKSMRRLSNIDTNSAINTHILVAIMHHIGILTLEDMEDENKVFENFKNEIPDLNSNNADTLFIRALKDQINNEIHKNYLK